MDFGFWILDFGFRILDFGFWILDLGFWILEFGFWILDQFSLRSFCGGPKRRRLDFGFWILDFGLDEASTDIVWILHKIFPCHADSGRRIYIYMFVMIYNYILEPIVPNFARVFFRDCRIPAPMVPPSWNTRRIWKTGLYRSE